MPSFCRGVCEFTSLLERPTWEKFNEFLALAMRLLALEPTPLLLRFFSASPGLPGGLPLPLRFSPLAAWSLVLGGQADAPSDLLESGEGDFLSVSEASVAESGLEEEPPPNILFSRPPREERLLRLFPARFVK